MKDLAHKLKHHWRSVGPRYLPFADVASKDLPLSRLIRLSLFQVSVGMTLVLLVGTLNRVMIVELNVPSSLVGLMLAMPLLFAPFRVLVGFRSDTHRCALGWRRVPFIWNGTLLTFGGLSIMPFALLVLGRQGESADLPIWIGLGSAGIAFLLAGAGVHIVQTAGLALATDLTPRESHARVVGFMYVALLLGMLVSALVFGSLLHEFSPAKLIKVIQASAVITVILNVVSIWKQETRHSARLKQAQPNDMDATFMQAFTHFCTGPNATRRLAIIGIGTLAFGMAELILEPFGGQVLSLSVSATTKLTALLALGGLIGFAFASQVLSKGSDPYRISCAGAAIGLPAFAFVMLSVPLAMPVLFLLGNFLIGFGGALFGHATLTATMNSASKNSTGMALGAWGSVQATAAGLGIALSGVIRDVVNHLNGNDPALGYYVVYGIELILLVIAIAITLPLLQSLRTQQSHGSKMINNNKVT